LIKAEPHLLIETDLNHDGWYYQHNGFREYYHINIDDCWYPYHFSYVKSKFTF
jgi:hypothetical protein